MLQKTGRIKAQLLSAYKRKSELKRKSVGMVENLTFESIDEMKKYAEEHNKVIVYWWYEMGGCNNG